MAWIKATREPLTERPSRTSRWLMLVGALSVAAIGIGLLVLMTQATGNRERYNHNYEWLVLINTVVASGLLITILWGMVRLLRSVYKGQFGSRLLIKLAGIFALVGVIPGLLIYVVSYQFVSRSIESWFDVKVEAALVAGLNLGRATLDTLSGDLSKQSRAAAADWAETSELNPALAAEKIRTQLGASDVAIWSQTGQVVASAGPTRFQLKADRPTTQQLREARQNGSLAWVEGLDEAIPGGDKGRIKVLVLFPQWSLALSEDRRLLMVTQELPPTLVNNALEVQAAYREYQERALARDGLRRMYIGTLTLSLFLAVLGAILLAVLLGNQLARPLLLLAHGMRQVAAGDLRPKLALQGKDELGGLTRSFADMTQQLADARASGERSLSQLDQARSKLQTILDNLTAGGHGAGRTRHHRISQPRGHTHFARAGQRARRARPARLARFAGFCARSGCAIPSFARRHRCARVGPLAKILRHPRRRTRVEPDGRDLARTWGHLARWHEAVGVR